MCMLGMRGVCHRPAGAKVGALPLDRKPGIPHFSEKRTISASVHLSLPSTQKLVTVCPGAHHLPSLDLTFLFACVWRGGGPWERQLTPLWDLRG